MKGTASSSKFDADDWWKITGSNVFKHHSVEPRKSFPRMTKKLRSQQLQICENLQPLLPCQLTSLNKSQIVRATGEMSQIVRATAEMEER